MRFRFWILASSLMWIVPCVAEQPRGIFPEIPGWKLHQEQTVYTSENLWDVIDGAADLYLEYDIVDLHIARYRNASGIEIKVELYRHKTAADAFGIYSQERYPDYHFIDLGVQGYLEKGVLNFLAGQYYAKLSSIQWGQEVQDALRMIGMKLQEQLHAGSSWPAVLDVFPADGKQPNSEQYIAKNFMGYGFLNGAFVVSYGEGSPLKAFIIQTASLEQVKEVGAKYLATLGPNAYRQIAEGSYHADDPHNGPVEIALRGRFLCGTYGTNEKVNADRILETLGRNISSVK